MDATVATPRPTMRSIGLPSWLFLAYVLLLVPRAAFRTRRRLQSAWKDAGGGGAASTPTPRARIYASTLASLAVLFVVSWLTARSFGYGIFAVPALGAREALAGAAALALHFAFTLGSRALRPPEERRAMPVYRLIPRTRGEWALYAALAFAAGVAEEAAYRGVLMSVLWYALGDPWIAATIAAAAFAASHALQGWKSGVAIFLVALVQHGLVLSTETLVVAMVVHAAFDLGAGAVGAWRIRSGQVPA